MTGSLSRGNILIFHRPSLAFEHPFESRSGLWRFGQVGSWFVRVILAWPAGPLDKVVEGDLILRLSKISSTSHSSWGSSRSGIIIRLSSSYSAVVIIEELDGKDIVKSGEYIGERKAISLTTDAF
jgi:hypothetical protein